MCCPKISILLIILEATKAVSAVDALPGITDGDEVQTWLTGSWSSRINFIQFDALLPENYIIGTDKSIYSANFSSSVSHITLQHKLLDAVQIVQNELIIAHEYCLLKIGRDQYGNVIRNELLAGNCTDTSQSISGTLLQTRFQRISDILLVSGSRILVADRNSYKIREMDLNKKCVDDGTSVDDIIRVMILHPTNPKLLLVAIAHGIGTVDLENGVYRRISGTETEGIDDGIMSVARYNYPSSIFSLSETNWLVGDRSNNALRLISEFDGYDANGNVQSICGQNVLPAEKLDVNGNLEDCRLSSVASKSFLFDGLRIMFASGSTVKYIGSDKQAIVGTSAQSFSKAFKRRSGGAGCPTNLGDTLTVSARNMKWCAIHCANHRGCKGFIYRDGTKCNLVTQLSPETVGSQTGLCYTMLP